MPPFAWTHTAATPFNQSPSMKESHGGNQDLPRESYASTTQPRRGDLIVKLIVEGLYKLNK